MDKPGGARETAIDGVVDNLRRVVQVVHGYSKRAERVGGARDPGSTAAWSPRR